MTQNLVPYKRRPRPQPQAQETQETTSVPNDDNFDDEHDDQDPQGHVVPPPSTARTQATASDETKAKRSEGVANPTGKNTGGASAGSTSWSNKEADLMWAEMCGDEHPNALKNINMTPYDVMLNVVRTDGPRQNVGRSIPGQAVMGDASTSPSDAIREYITDNCHLPIATGPARLEVIFMKRSGTIYGRGTLDMPSPEQIQAVRMAQGKSRQAGQQMPQQPYAQAPYGQQPPQYAPPPQAAPTPPGTGYAPSYAPQAAPYDPRSGAPSHDPEVSNLRAEVAGLGGAVRELMEYVRGDRRQPPPPPVPAPGVGAPQYTPPPSPFQRRPPVDPVVEDIRDEMADLRSDLNELTQAIRGGMGRPGFGGAPPAAAAAVPLPPPPPPPPRGPNGEIWVESARQWCLPVGMAPAQAAPAVAAAPAPQPVAQPATPPAGVGAAPPVASTLQQAQDVVNGFQSLVTQAKQLRQVTQQLSQVFGAETGLGAVEPEPEPEPEPEAAPTPELEWDTIPVPNTEFFGHPAMFTPNKKTGKIDWTGVVVSNPGIVEQGIAIAGKLADAAQEFAKRATPGTVGAPGVGAAHVVNEIPANAQPANVSPPAPQQQSYAPPPPTGFPSV